MIIFYIFNVYSMWRKFRIYISIYLKLREGIAISGQIFSTWHVITPVTYNRSFSSCNSLRKIFLSQ